MTNEKLRKNYNCNEATDYYNKVGHGCYENSTSTVSTILIGLAIIIMIYALLYYIPKKVLPKIKEKKENKKQQKEKGR